MALTCPNKNTKEWRRLSANRPDVDSYIWAKYDGLIPELEYTNPSQRSGFKISNSAADANLSKEQVDSMYEDYSKMMNRKRKGFELTREAFDHAFRKLSLLQIGDSKILGEWDLKNNLFKGRVLSSPSIRTLVKDMQDIKSSVNFMASVPPDMGKMLDRLGFVSVEQSKSFDFERKDKDGNIIASEAMEKSLYFSDELLIEKVFGTTKDKIDVDAIQQYDSFFSKISIMTNIINGLETNQPANKIADELKKLSIYDQSASKIIRKYSQFVKDSKRNALIESLMLYKSLYKENGFKQLSDKELKTKKQFLISEVKNINLSSPTEQDRNNLRQKIKSLKAELVIIEKENKGSRKYFEQLERIEIEEQRLEGVTSNLLNPTKRSTSLAETNLPYDVESRELRKINETFEFLEVINKLVSTIERAAANKFVEIDTLSAPKVYDEVDGELNKTLVQYLSKFGIKTELLENIQEELNIDSYATADILNKILYADKNDQTELPQKASELIVYMMQFNPAVTEIMKYMDTKSMFRRGAISKSEKLKTIADLLAVELSKKTGTEIPKTLSDKLKMLFRQFLSFLSVSGQARVNRKIGYIADQVLLQNQSLITASVFKPGKFGMNTMQVSLQDAIEADGFGDGIIEKLSKAGFMLVGSTAIGEQGIIKRPNENLLHDIDVASPFKREKTVRKFKKAYPNAIKVRSIFSQDQVTDSYLIVPEGYKVENLEMPTINGKITLQSYDIMDSNGERKGTFRRDKNGNEAKENNLGIEGKVIDLFSYWGEAPDNSLMSQGIQISHWVEIFKAKLGYARYKDIWDYNRFIPYDRMEELGLTDPRESGANVQVKQGVSELFKEQPELSNIGTEQEYSQYLESIFPESKVKDVVYHGGGDLKKGIDDFVGTENDGMYFAPLKDSWNEVYTKGKTKNFAIINITNSKKDANKSLKEFERPEETKEYLNLIESAKDIGSKKTYHGGNLKIEVLKNGYIQHYIKFSKENDYGKDSEGFTKVGKRTFLNTFNNVYINNVDGIIHNRQYVVFSPEQIYVLGSTEDIQGFKEFVGTSSNVMNQVTGTEGTAASPQVLEKVKKVLEKMGVKVQDILEYAKGNPAVNISNVNALADLGAGIIGLAEGKEDVSLTEEMVHIATAILEQKNPKLITELISKIGGYKIYKDTLAEYRDLKAYQLPNGKPDIRKIKKEAVDKLIAEIIVGGDVEAYTEDVRSLARRMWDTITAWFRGQYKKANIDIFSETADAVIGGDFEGSVIDLNSKEIYYQATPQQEKFQRLIEQTRGTLRKIETNEEVDPLLADEEKATSYYELLVNGKYERITKRVTDRVKIWYRQRFGDTVFSEDEKRDNEVKRSLGTKYHDFFDIDIHQRFFNPDGTRRVNPGERPVYDNDLDNKVYTKLEKYYTDLIASFSENGKNPLVFSELQVYDKKEKEAGTIDLLIVEEDGTAHIYDWKFMSVAQGAEDVAWFKQGAYDVQLGRYKNILINNYGIKKIGKNRAIPIVMNLKRENFQDPTSKLELKGIKIGSVNPNGIEDLTITPVSEQSESTGNEKLDDLLGELNAVYSQISKTVVTNDQESLYKIERMNILKKAMRMMQSQQQMEPLVDAIKVMQREGENIIAEYKTSYEGRPASDKDLTDKELSDFSANMTEYIASSEVFGSIAVVLGDMIYNKEMDGLLGEEEIESRKKKLGEMEQQSLAIQRSRIDIIKISGKFADKFIGQRNLVSGLMNPERVVKGMASLFKSTSEIGLKALDILFTMANRAMGFANQDSLNQVNELLEIRDRIKASGGDLRKKVLQIYQKDDKGKIVNKLIYKYQRKFFDDVKSNAAEGRRSKKWIKDNIDVDAYKEESSKILEERVRRINQTQPDETLKKKMILEEYQKWDISRSDFNGYGNFVIKRHPLPKWESQEYLNLKKDKDLFDLYNFITKINNSASDTGYLNNAVQSTFLPFVRKTSAERITWDGSLTSINNFGAKLTVQADEVGYGSINELTGEIENSVPKYYTNDFSFQEDGTNDYSDVSMDLFKNMIMYINHSNKYKYLTSVENQLLLVKTQEKFKKHLQTTAFSKASKKDGKVVERKGNQNNIELIDQFFRNILYGQKYALDDSDVDIPMVPSMIKGVSKIINTASKAITGKEVIKEGATPTTGSLIKLMDFLNRYVQIKSLGFKSISGAANYFGGNLQISALAGKYFDTREVVKYQGKLLGNRFRNDDERNMFIQLIDTFMPMKDDPTYDKMRESGMSFLTRRNWSDILFVWFRQPEQHLEKSIFAALLDNMMIEDGKIVNIRDFVKSKYKNRYDSSAEFRSVKSKIDQEISQLKKTRSINAIKKLENGKLVIPGLDLSNREELQRLTTVAREIARTATGGATEFDNIRANMNVWTKSLMVFKGWIPKLALTRFGEFRKVADNFSVEIDADGLTTGERYDLGRAKMFFGDFTSFIIIPKIKTIIDTLKVTEAGIEKIDEMFEKYQKQHEETFGEPANITREDFADLVRSNLRNQIKELVLLISLISMSIALGWLAPDDDEDRAAKNKFRYFQKVLDKFISEVGFFYNPAEMASTLDGGMPAIGFFTDVQRAITHFTKETTGYDLFKPGKTPEEVRKTAQPVKNIMKLFPVSNSLLPILASFDAEFAKEMDITISNTSR